MKVINVLDPRLTPKENSRLFFLAYGDSPANYYKITFVWEVGIYVHVCLPPGTCGPVRLLHLIGWVVLNVATIQIQIKITISAGTNIGFRCIK